MRDIGQYIGFGPAALEAYRSDLIIFAYLTEGRRGAIAGAYFSCLGFGFTLLGEPETHLPNCKAFRLLETECRITEVQKVPTFDPV